MHVRDPSSDPTRATTDSLGQLQRAFARLSSSPVSSTRNAGITPTVLQLLTCGAVATSPGEPSPASRLLGRPQLGAHAALLGLGKVAALEMPSLACAALDVDIRAVHDPLGHAPAGVADDSDAHGVAVRCGTCLAPRLLPAPAKSSLRRPKELEDAAMHSGTHWCLSATFGNQASEGICWVLRFGMRTRRCADRICCQPWFLWCMMSVVVLRRRHRHRGRSRCAGRPHSAVAHGAALAGWRPKDFVSLHCRPSRNMARLVPRQPHWPARRQRAGCWHAVGTPAGGLSSNDYDPASRHGDPQRGDSCSRGGPCSACTRARHLHRACLRRAQGVRPDCNLRVAVCGTSLRMARSCSKWTTSLRGMTDCPLGLQDGLLVNQSAASTRTVFAPKVCGALRLVEMSAALPLRWVLHSKSRSTGMHCCCHHTRSSITQFCSAPCGHGSAMTANRATDTPEDFMIATI